MVSESRISMVEHFGQIEDPRKGPALLHKLIDILVIALCGVISGADSWVEIEAFGQAKEGWLRSILELPNGIPSHDTLIQSSFRRVLCSGRKRLARLPEAKSLR